MGKDICYSSKKVSYDFLVSKSPSLGFNLGETESIILLYLIWSPGLPKDLAAHKLNPQGLGAAAMLINFQASLCMLAFL